MGFLVMLRDVIKVALHLVFDVVILLFAALTYPSRQDEQPLNLQGC